MKSNTGAKLSAIVSGGALGIGRAVSFAFAKEGINVLLVDINREA